MSVKYTRVNWQDAPSVDTPVNAANLNHMDNGILLLSEEYDTDVPLMKRQIFDLQSNLEEYLVQNAGRIVTEWLDEHVTPGGSTVVIDDTLTIQGAAADAKKTGDELSTLKEEISQLSGLSEEVKVALLQIASKVAYIDEHGQDYYDDLYDSLYPPADLVSISCVYTQSGTVYDTDSLDSLKSDLVVTAHMSDSTTRTVTDYTLSGTLAEGTSIVTVAYGGKTTTFNVTVSHASDPSERWTDGVAYDPTIIANQYYEKDTGAIKPYSGWDRTDYMPCKNAQIIDVPAIPQIDASSTIANNAFFDASYNVVQASIYALKNHTTTHRVPSNAAYFGVSSESDALATCVADGIIPYAPKSVSNMNGWANGIAYADLTIVQDSYITNAGAIQPYAGWDRTDYVPCNGLESITFSPLPQQSGTVDYCGFYYKDKAFCKKITLSKTENSTITVPNGAYYFIISSERAALASCISGGIVPNT